MKTILITGIGGPTPRSIAKTIKLKNPQYRIIGVDANPKAIGFFIPDLIDQYFVVPRVDEKEYWPIINEIIKKCRIDFAFVQPEMEVIGWGNYFNEYGEFPCPVLLPPVELASVLMDKSKMADILKETQFIPKTIKVSQSNIDVDKIEKSLGYPCWIRATEGSGGLGSLKVENSDNLESWMFINKDIEEYTISEYLTGRHLATQMLYYEGEYIKGASLECSEYVMASIAPSKVTGNTSFGRLINEDHILSFCDDCIKYICNKLNIIAHGVLSFDLKEDANGDLKVTEVNIRHMAYTGVMAEAGFNLVRDTIKLLDSSNPDNLIRQQYFKYSKPYVFLRDVDVEPILLESETIFKHVANQKYI